MSRKSPDPIFIVPDESVARYSPEMESCFEMLHRAVSRGTTVPDSVDSIIGLVKQIWSLYYAMRDHFEADGGISLAVADALPQIDLGHLLKMLYAWEEDHEVGRREYEQRDRKATKAPLYADPADRFHGYADCWRQYRVWIFEANRVLTICRKRVSAEAPDKPPRRYEWLN
jgi:hypothetical protein